MDFVPASRQSCAKRCGQNSAPADQRETSNSNPKAILVHSSPM
jgi:hypothetical protein